MSVSRHHPLAGGGRGGIPGGKETFAQGKKHSPPPVQLLPLPAHSSRNALLPAAEGKYPPWPTASLPQLLGSETLLLSYALVCRTQPRLHIPWFPYLFPIFQVSLSTKSLVTLESKRCPSPISVLSRHLFSHVCIPVSLLFTLAPPPTPDSQVPSHSSTCCSFSQLRFWAVMMEMLPNTTPAPTMSKGVTVSEST